MSHDANADSWWTDLALIAVLSGLAAVALLAPAVPRVVEWAVGVPLLVVAPGWALVSALLPGEPVAEDERTTAEVDGGPGWPVRIALSLLGSILIVALIALGLSATVGIRLVPAVLAVVVVTLGLTLLAVARRQAVPVGRRATPLASRGGMPGPRIGRTSVQTMAMIIALAALASAVAFAGANPGSPDGYTEFYVLHEGDDGNLTASGFPTEFPADEGQPLHFAIENEEGQPMTYEVVVLAQGNGTADGTVLDRFETQVPAGERIIAERTVTPTEVDGRTRLDFLLYEGSAPGEPTASNADSSLHLWVDVTEGSVP